MLAFLLSLCLFQIEGSSVEGGRTSPDGREEIQIDLPGAEHMKNTGGRDGAGLCVFTSVEHAGRWQNVESIRGFQTKMTKELGGGYPSKLEKMMGKYCTGAQFLQYEGNDPSLVKLALSTGRMPAVTYGYSPRYGSGKIAHMVNIAHLSDRWAAILDNNFPGENRYEWMAPEEFRKRWISGGGGWAVFLLAPPPPPVPVNANDNQVVYGAIKPRGGGGWGANGCPSVEGDSNQSEYKWVEFADDDGGDQIALYRKSVQVGIWSRAGNYYRELRLDGSFGPRQDKAPVEIPAIYQRSRRVEQGPLFFGVERDKIDQGCERFFLDGREVNRTKAFQILKEGNTLTDDRSKLRLTVIGSAEQCRQIINDMDTNADLKAWSEQVLIQCYRPNDWAVANVGFAPGAPRIVVQSGPDANGNGKVLHSQADYDGGAVKLAQALRKVRPDYDPKKDPDKRKEADAPASGGLSFVLMLAAGIATMFGLPWLGKIIASIPAILPFFQKQDTQNEQAKPVSRKPKRNRKKT